MSSPFVVADGLHHLDLGTLLLEHLAVAAPRHSISTFYAETLASNQPMLAVFLRRSRPRPGPPSAYLSLAPLFGQRTTTGSAPPTTASGPRCGRRDAGLRMLVPTDRVERRRESASKHRLGLIIVGCRRRAAEAVSAGITITIDESGDIDACDVLAYLALGNDVEAGRVEVGRPRRARPLWRWRELPFSSNL